MENLDCFESETIILRQWIGDLERVEATEKFDCG